MAEADSGAAKRAPGRYEHGQWACFPVDWGRCCGCSFMGYAALHSMSDDDLWGSLPGGRDLGICTL